MIYLFMWTSSVSTSADWKRCRRDNWRPLEQPNVTLLFIWRAYTISRKRRIYYIWSSLSLLLSLSDDSLLQRRLWCWGWDVGGRVVEDNHRASWLRLAIRMYNQKQWWKGPSKKTKQWWMRKRERKKEWERAGTCRSYKSRTRVLVKGGR